MILDLLEKTHAATKVAGSPCYYRTETFLLQNVDFNIMPREKRVREKRVKYFDSVGNTAERYVNGLLRSLQHGHQDKKQG